ncbi:hypothetical protein [uncultured Jannaschia sp.]|nr:hypothetical protein [uncultured Jannaschia sp.]
MTNATALFLALALLCAIGADVVLNDGAALVFLARRMVEFVAWLAFWR